MPSGRDYNAADMMSRLCTAGLEYKPVDDEISWYLVEVSAKAKPEESLLSWDGAKIQMVLSNSLKPPKYLQEWDT